MQETPAGKATPDPLAPRQIPGSVVVSPFARRVIAAPVSAANELLASGAFFTGGGPNAVVLTVAEALAKWASDGDVRAWIKVARPGQRRRLNSLQTIHCISVADVEHMREVAAYWAERSKLPVPKYRGGSCSEYEDWSRGMRQERVL